MKLADKLRARLQAPSSATIAQEWINKGFRTTPVAAPIKGDRKSGKNPNVAGDGWWDRADHKGSFDPSRYLNRNVGICGGYELEGGGWLLVLDPDGEEGLRELSELGELPKTFTVRSGSGVGKHYYLRSSKQLGGTKIADHVDTRGKGGQVVAPGCLHYSGGKYEIEVDAPIAWAPAWVEERLQEPRTFKRAVDLSGVEPIELTREMLRAKADELGEKHKHYGLFDKLAKGAPVAARGTRHEVADINGTKTLVRTFGLGITDESVLKLFQPTYPGWVLEPAGPGPGSDVKNWNDFLNGLHGARELAPQLDIERLRKKRAEREQQEEALQAEALENFTVTEKMATSATTALKKEIKFVAADFNQLSGAAFRLGRYTPHVLNTEHVKKELFKAATQHSKGGADGFVTDSEARAIIDSGVERGQKKPLFVYAGWRKQLVVDQEKGTVIVCDENAALFFQHHPEVDGLIRFNVRKGKPFFEYAPTWQTSRTEFPCPIEDRDAVDAGRWLATQMGKPMAGAERTLKALNTVAENNQYDPFEDWLKGLSWDGVPRLDSWLSKTCGVEDNDYHQAVGSKFVISAVARTLTPGCDAQHVLVLVGPQGIGKSRAFRTLCGAEYFCSNIGDIHKEEAVFNLSKYVIVELAELAAFKKAEMETIKRFISDTSEDLRRKYARNSEAVIRRAVFGATTNVKEFLQDPTGNRRFWPVECRGAVNTDWLEENRDQLWAEALVRHTAGETWWLDQEQEKILKLVHEGHTDTDALMERLEFFNKPFERWPQDVLGQTMCAPGQVEAGSNRFLWVTIPQVHLILGTDIRNRTDQIRVKRMLQQKGWHESSTRIDQIKVKIFRMVEPGTSGTDSS